MNMNRNGGLVGHDTIAIDYWDRSDARPRLHFLTHLHADHIQGLTSLWSFPIYTSNLNCKLAHEFIPGINRNVLKPLKLNEEVKLPLNDSLSVLVTLLDANHVPGAVMILVKGFFGNILYTGDFRFDPSMLQIPRLRQVVNREDLDVLHLDNTFFYPTCDFPSRKDVTKKLLDLIDRFPAHHIYVGIRKIGKECVLVELAQRLNERILVSEEKLRMLGTIGCPDVFTTDPNKSRIYCVHMNLLKRKFIESENLKRPTIGIMLTALYYGWDNASIAAPYSASASYGLHVVEYSDHSSYNELLEFVRALKPKKVVPIVTSDQAFGLMKEWPAFHKYRIDMTPFRPFLSTIREKPWVIPESLDESLPLQPMIGPKRLEIKERIYRGPKGPVYETTVDTTNSEDHGDVFEFHLRSLEDIDKKIGQVTELSLDILQSLDQSLSNLKNELVV